MKNKFRRSMTSVLLAASLLFSSQSVIAFADYGSKSDASDLSPVQESVETVEKNEQTTFEETEESKEELTTSEKSEETTGTEESTTPEETTTTEQPAPAAPVTTPATLDAKEFNYSEHTFTYKKGDAGIASVSYYDKYGNSGTISEGKSITTESTLIHQNTTTFIVTTKSGYKLVGLTGDNVETNAFTVLGNNQYEFHFTDKSGFDFKEVSFSLETAKIEYEFIDEEGHSLGTATIGDTISLKDPEDNPDLEFVGWYVGDIKLEGSLTEDIIAYADENNQIKVEAKYEDKKPFWTFKADKNGKVQLNDEAPKDSIVFTKTQVEALNNGKDDFLYVVPNEGYGFAGCTGNQVLVETGLCLDNLNKNVEFYSTAHFNPLVNITFNPGDHGTLVDSSKSTGTITSDYNLAYLAFPEVTPDDGYKLVGWKREGSSEIETVSVKTPVEYVTEGITYIAQYEEVPAEKIRHIEVKIGDNLKKELKDLEIYPFYLHAEYDGKYIFLSGTKDTKFTTTLITELLPEDLKKLVIEAFEGGPIPENLRTDVNDPTKAQKFFSGFTFKNLWLNHTESISCGYISEAYVDGTTLYMTLETPTTEVPEVKPDSFDNIPVAFVCENEKVQHEKGTVLKTISLKESGLSYTYDENEVETGALTLHFDENPIEDYLSLVGKYTSGHVYTYDDSSIDLQYDEATKTWYAPSETEGQQDSYKIYVTCDEDIPDKPTVEDIRDELKVVLDCITEQNHHDSKTYALLETDAFEIVGPYVAPMPLSYEGDMTTPHYFAQVRVKTNSLLEDYNTDHTVHTYAANNPDAIFVLAGNPAPRSTEYMWDLLGEDTIVLKVQHTNPTDPTDPTDPGTNPGGNGGDNDDDDDRYTGDNTVTRTINDDDVPLNDRPTNTTIIDDEDVPLADLPDDTVTIDDGEVPLKANPSTGDSLPFAAMAAAALSLGGVIVLNRKKK